MDRLVLLAKAPAKGRVKTRLVPPLSPEQALLLHEAMLLDQVRFLRELSATGCEIEARFDAPLPEGAVSASLDGVSLRPQGDGDLGARMRRASEDAFASGAFCAGILGGDAPTLPSALVLGALARVREGADAAVVPALDGGYVFLALRPRATAILEKISWGSASVLAETRARAAEARIRLDLLPAWGDLDAASDLGRIAREAERDPSRAPSTSAALLGLDLSKARMI